MLEIKFPSMEPYKQEIARFFNVILGNRPESEKYWKQDIKERLIRKFGPQSLSQSESAEDFSLNYQIDYVALFHRIQTKTGVCTFRN
jgi:hypothetical protein